MNDTGVSKVIILGIVELSQFEHTVSTPSPQSTEVYLGL